MVGVSTELQPNYVRIIWMRTELAREWAEALESGDYEQGKTVLAQVTNEGKKYCCLGVLCELAIKHGIELDVTREQDNILYDERIGVLPPSVLYWADIDSEDGDVKLGDEFASELNDKMNFTFTEIAQCIRQQFVDDEFE